MKSTSSISSVPHTYDLGALKIAKDEKPEAGQAVSATTSGVASPPRAGQVIREQLMQSTREQKKMEITSELQKMKTTAVRIFQNTVFSYGAMAERILGNKDIAKLSDELEQNEKIATGIYNKLQGKIDNTKKSCSDIAANDLESEAVQLSNNWQTDREIFSALHSFSQAAFSLQRKSYAQAMDYAIDAMEILKAPYDPNEPGPSYFSDNAPVKLIDVEEDGYTSSGPKFKLSPSSDLTDLYARTRRIALAALATCHIENDESLCKAAALLAPYAFHYLRSSYQEFFPYQEADLDVLNQFWKKLKKPGSYPTDNNSRRQQKKAIDCANRLLSRYQEIHEVQQRKMEIFARLNSHLDEKGEIPTNIFKEEYQHLEQNFNAALFLKAQVMCRKVDAYAALLSDSKKNRTLLRLYEESAENILNVSDALAGCNFILNPYNERSLTSHPLWDDSLQDAAKRELRYQFYNLQEKFILLQKDFQQSEVGTASKGKVDPATKKNNGGFLQALGEAAKLYGQVSDALTRMINANSDAGYMVANPEQMQTVKDILHDIAWNSGQDDAKILATEIEKLDHLSIDDHKTLPSNPKKGKPKNRNLTSDTKASRPAPTTDELTPQTVSLKKNLSALEREAYEEMKDLTASIRESREKASYPGLPPADCEKYMEWAAAYATQLINSKENIIQARIKEFEATGKKNTSLLEKNKDDEIFVKALKLERTDCLEKGSAMRLEGTLRFYSQTKEPLQEADFDYLYEFNEKCPRDQKILTSVFIGQSLQAASDAYGNLRKEEDRDSNAKWEIWAKNPRTGTSFKGRWHTHFDRTSGELKFHHFKSENDAHKGTGYARDKETGEILIDPVTERPIKEIVPHNRIKNNRHKELMDKMKTIQIDPRSYRRQGPWLEQLSSDWIS